MQIDDKEWEIFVKYWFGKYNMKPDRYSVEGYLDWKEEKEGNKCQQKQ